MYNLKVNIPAACLNTHIHTHHICTYSYTLAQNRQFSAHSLFLPPPPPSLSLPLSLPLPSLLLMSIIRTYMYLPGGGVKRDTVQCTGIYRTMWEVQD